MTPRKYQTDAVNQLFLWLSQNDGNPCLVLPTGAGKSILIAMIVEAVVKRWGVRVLVLAHQKELIEQNAEKLLRLWPNAPMGIVSASVGRKDWGHPITYAGIQTVRGKSDQLGPVECILVDEAHLINHEEEGSYRALVDEYPNARIIGLTATPYRLGHGLITDKPALFDDLIEPVSIVYLQAKGYLARLRSKVTAERLDVDGVHKRGGEYIESELQAAVDVKLKNEGVVEEVLKRSQGRDHWLFFCAGVKHAQHMAEILRARGVAAEAVTGEMPKLEREDVLSRYKAGELKALTNANILTTGFDYPEIDLIAMVRPTCSAGLYMQMAGRGLRVKADGRDCLVLDFAGNVEKHGPITAVTAPDKVKKGDGIPPCKICPECSEIVHASAKTCPACGYEFLIKKKETYTLSEADIMGHGVETMELDGWEWYSQDSKAGDKMIVVKYNPRRIGDRPVYQYFCLWHPSAWVAKKARNELWKVIQECGITELDTEVMNTSAPVPAAVKYKMEGKFPRVLERVWEEAPF